MSSSPRWLRVASACCLGFALLTSSSCQRYQAKPLALQERMHQWATYDRDYLQQQFATINKPGAFNIADGINLAEAESIALFYNPSLQRARLQTLSHKADAEHAGLWQDPELHADGSYIVEQVDERLEAGLTLQWSLPLSGRNNAAKQLAVARFHAAKQQIVLNEWRLLQELRQQWVLLHARTQHVQLTKAYLSDLEKSISIATDLAGAQFIEPHAVQALKLEQAQIQHQQLQEHGALKQQQLLIVNLLGLHPELDWPLQAHALQQPALPESAALLTHPLIQQHSLQYLIAERSLAHEIRKQYPDLSLGFGFGKKEGYNRFLFGFGINPLALWNRNKQGIAVARAERAYAGLDAEIALRDLVNRQHQLRADRQQQLSELTHLQERIQPLAALHIQSIRDSFATGDIDILELINALKNSFESRVQELELQSALRINEIALAGLAVPLNQEETSHE